MTNINLTLVLDLVHNAAHIPTNNLLVKTVLFECTPHLISLTLSYIVSHISVVVSKHGLYAGGLGSIPTAITTMTAAG